MLCAPVRRQETFHQHPELIDHVDDEIAGLGWIRFFHRWIKRPDL